MRLIILLTMVLVSSLFSQVQVMQPIDITFNNNVYSRNMPKTYDESVVVIRDLSRIINEFSIAVIKMNSGVDTISLTMKQSRDDINTYLDSIVRINHKIDSLVEDIRVRDVNIQLYTMKETERLKEVINKIPVRPILNFGFGGGYSYTTIDNGGELSVSPIVNFKKLFIIGSCGYGIDTKYTRLGLQVGLFLK